VDDRDDVMVVEWEDEDLDVICVCGMHLCFLHSFYSTFSVSALALVRLIPPICVEVVDVLTRRDETSSLVPFYLLTSSVGEKCFLSSIGFLLHL
jgi:hypothetical protein